MTPAARLVVVLALTALAAPAAAPPARAAQAAFATFSGSVVDPMSRVLPAVTLVLTNQQTQAKNEVRSDRNGQFEVVGLPPGEYALETKLAGFAPLKDVVTISGANVKRDLMLRVGALQETITVVVSASEAPRAPDAPKAPIRKPIRSQSDLGACPNLAAGGNIRPPRKLVDMKPVFPPQLRDAQVGGVVVLDARIATDGMVRDVDVVSAAHPDLARAAVDAVRQWEFDTTLLNCEPIEVTMGVTVTFTIRP